jgi:hypothetical protein
VKPPASTLPVDLYETLSLKALQEWISFGRTPRIKKHPTPPLVMSRVSSQGTTLSHQEIEDLPCTRNFSALPQNMGHGPPSREAKTVG